MRKSSRSSLMIKMVSKPSHFDSSVIDKDETQQSTSSRITPERHLNRDSMHLVPEPGSDRHFDSDDSVLDENVMVSNPDRTYGIEDQPSTSGGITRGQHLSDFMHRVPEPDSDEDLDESVLDKDVMVSKPSNFYPSVNDTVKAQTSASCGITRRQHLNDLMRHAPKSDSDEDFDSDDSVLDKDYVPPYKNSSESEMDTSIISNSQSILGVYIPETPEQTFDGYYTDITNTRVSFQINENTYAEPRDSKQPEKSQEEQSECSSSDKKDFVYCTIELEEQLEESRMSNDRPWDVLEKSTEDFSNTEADGERDTSTERPGVAEPTIELTKKGTKRKRRVFQTSQEVRKKHKFDEKVLNKYSVKPGCDAEKCRNKCNENIAAERRHEINKSFWLMTWKEQKIFIKSNTSCIKPVRVNKIDKDATKTDKKIKHRTTTIKYFLSKETGEKICVCKLFFLTTLGYSKNNAKPVRYALRDRHDIPLDRRGINAKKQKVDHDVIKRHIESFQPTISHYRREHAPNRRYLSSELSVQFMFNDFIETHANLPKISYDLYRLVIKNMNISFAKLGHEECEVCEQYEIHNPRAKELRHRNCESCLKFEKHHDKYTQARKLYDENRKAPKSADIGFFSADLQKVIMLPRIEMFKAVLFCPRLIVLNESFVPLGPKTSDHMTYAAIWHEAISGRKKDDIISTFKAFLEHYRDLETIVLWLDNCSAQNKNWALFSFIIYFINSKETSSNQITFRYFEPGHTFMSADEFHHQVEHALKRMNKVYDFEDFAKAVASTNNRKTVVKKMDVSDFFKIPDDTSTPKIQKAEPRAYLRDMSEVCFKRGSHFLFYKCSLSSPDYIKLDVLKTTIKKKGFTMPTQKTTPRGITNERKQNIITRLGSMMPPTRKQFWENLPVNESAENLNIVHEED